MSAKRMYLCLFPFVSLALASLNPAYAQAGPKGDAPSNLQVGYVIVTPSAANTTGLVVFETFGQVRGAGALQAGVLPANMLTSAMLFVTTSSRLSRNLGVAVANPNTTVDAGLTFTLRNSDGSTVAIQTVTLKALHQTSQFVTQLFAGKLPPAGDFNGTLKIESTTPVAMVGLRFRGENFSTIPVTPLSAATVVPINGSAGGSGAVILPQFADGGGWASEIVLSNSSENAALVVRVDIFNQDGTPLSVTLNGTTASSFTGLNIPAKGVLVLAPVKNMHDDDDF